MTDIEQFNLYWLCHAMTEPVSAEELYFYDGHTRKFFVERSANLFDMVDLPLGREQTDELTERLKTVDSESPEIVEIPRLNVQDKVAIQLLFLSKFPGIIHEVKLRLTAELQQDAPGFVLDKLEAMDPALSPLSIYWDNFKLKTIQYYLEKFTGIIGIASKMF